MSTIKLETVNKTFGKQKAVEDLSFSVESGTVFGFLGPNGAGKTTTIRMILGLLAPDSGKVELLGKTPTSATFARVGYLPGELRLYEDLTGIEHLDLLSRLQGAPTPLRAELLDSFSLPRTTLVRPIHTWSRGTKQKLGLVQAFWHEPELVILDEPSEGLDPLVQQTFFQVVNAAKARGTTVFMSSHILSEVQRVCDIVAILNAGKLGKVAPLSELALEARNVTLTFASRPRLKLPYSSHWEGNNLHLTVPVDEVVELLRQVMSSQLKEVLVEEPSLEDMFLHFYEAAK